MKFTAENIENVISKFKIEGEVKSYEPYGNGHINNTYLVVSEEDGKTIRYILQSVNNVVFLQPQKVIENIEKVTAFLGTKTDDKRRVLSMVETDDGKHCYIDEDGRTWRVYNFIEDSICLERPENTKDFYECAVAFGQFQRYLDEFPAEELFETIENFHNTPKRFRDFLTAIEENKAGRADSVKEEIEFFKAREAFYSVLYDNYNAGKLPLRVTHNDTKSNNVMLDAATHTALCVIDLDTIMPGFSVNDFGDSIRFGASTAAEDEKDLSKVKLDLAMFEAYVDGFITGNGGLIKNEEIMLLPEGSKMMTIECGMRFLTDYLNGDTYFKTAYPEHNLDRCHTQMKLVSEMEANWETMKDIVKKYVKD